MIAPGGDRPGAADGKDVRSDALAGARRCPRMRSRFPAGGRGSRRRGRLHLWGMFGLHGLKWLHPGSGSEEWIGCLAVSPALEHGAFERPAGRAPLSLPSPGRHPA